MKRDDISTIDSGETHLPCLVPCDEGTSHSHTQPRKNRFSPFKDIGKFRHLMDLDFILAEALIHFLRFKAYYLYNFYIFFPGLSSDWIFTNELRSFVLSFLITLQERRFSWKLLHFSKEIFFALFVSDTLSLEINSTKVEYNILEFIWSRVNR